MKTPGIVVRPLREATLAFYQSLDRYSLAEAVRAHPRSLPILRSAGKG